MWEEAANAFAVGSLDRIRTSAEKWTATIGTLIGLFGAVVIVGGPKSLADVASESLRPWIFWLLALAAVTSGVAIVLGAFAAQGLSRPIWDNWGADTFAAYVATNGTTADRQLVASRILGIAAAVLILLGGLLAAWSSLGASTSGKAPHAVVVRSDGNAVCGVVGARRDGALTIGGKTVVGVVQLVPVSSCTKSW